MFKHPLNDRTSIRLIGHNPITDKSTDTELMSWLQQQSRMLEGWQADIVSHNGNPQTAELIEAHRQWLCKALKALKYPDLQQASAL